MGVPWWPHGLRIQHCHSCGLGYCRGMGFSPWPGNFRPGAGQKKKKKEVITYLSSLSLSPSLPPPFCHLPSLSFSLSDIGGHSKRSPVCKSGRQFSPGTGYASTFETDQDVGPGTLCCSGCSACTWTNISWSNKIQETRGTKNNCVHAQLGQIMGKMI